MAMCFPGDKPLSEAMMVSLPSYICATRPRIRSGKLKVDHFESEVETRPFNS